MYVDMLLHEALGCAIETKLPTNNTTINSKSYHNNNKMLASIPGSGSTSDYASHMDGRADGHTWPAPAKEQTMHVLIVLPTTFTLRVSFFLVPDCVVV